MVISKKITHRSKSMLLVIKLCNAFALVQFLFYMQVVSLFFSLLARESKLESEEPDITLQS